ncbi:uncharacterized protein PRCAT00004764001 [Priceomyces carsonii]|uniref:uncharacterized protein n=1 Tax=Priceomyces carsonii TaxID=28549 RepID=UPI002EDA981F|nr:unnamed protein product [Priceomyces carsonii]
MALTHKMNQVVYKYTNRYAYCSFKAMYMGVGPRTLPQNYRRAYSNHPSIPTKETKETKEQDERKQQRNDQEEEGMNNQKENKHVSNRRQRYIQASKIY